MTFPRISTKASNFIITPHLESLLEQKFASLGRLIGDYGESRCDVEVEKMTGQQSGKIFRVEVNLHHNGKLYRVEATEEQAEQAIDVVRDELKHELQHLHGRRKSLTRKGSRELKSMMLAA